ncbi:hypothetical protein J6590_022536 [Homalodisca vitripennis]|nr:hypothetical protein J6590_022536 [Homalodisca vitripennis]
MEDYWIRLHQVKKDEDILIGPEQEASGDLTVQISQYSLWLVGGHKIWSPGSDAQIRVFRAQSVSQARRAESAEVALSCLLTPPPPHSPHREAVREKLVQWYLLLLISTPHTTGGGQGMLTTGPGYWRGGGGRRAGSVYSNYPTTNLPTHKCGQPNEEFLPRDLQQSKKVDKINYVGYPSPTHTAQL